MGEGENDLLPPKSKYSAAFVALVKSFSDTRMHDSTDVRAITLDEFQIVKP